MTIKPKTLDKYVMFEHLGIVRETERAVLVRTHDGDERWFPRAMILGEHGDERHFFVLKKFLKDEEQRHEAAQDADALITDLADTSLGLDEVVARMGARTR